MVKTERKKKILSWIVYLFWKMSVNFGMEAMLPCEESEALVGAGLGLMLATDSITEFSLSTESAIMNTLNISPCYI